MLLAKDSKQSQNNSKNLPRAMTVEECLTELLYSNNLENMLDFKKKVVSNPSQ